MKPQYLLQARDDFRSATGELKRPQYEQCYWEYEYVVWTEEDIIAWKRKCHGVDADGSDDQLLENEQANAVDGTAAKFNESMEPSNAARKEYRGALWRYEQRKLTRCFECDGDENY